MLEPHPLTGDRVAKALQDYVRETLHTPLHLGEWGDAGALPIFLTRRYRFWQGAILERACLFMALMPETEATPAEIAKHVALVEPQFDGIVVFAAEGLTAAARGRLIAQGVPFVVPNNQLYIPMLALDLRDHFRLPVRPPGERLTPAAQLVFFYYILHRDAATMTPTMLAEPLEFAAMSIGRAFDQLAAFNLATVERRGREKLLHYHADPRTLFEASRTLLQTPVRGLHGVKFTKTRPDMVRAGETALADRTNLAHPDRPTYAILATGWQAYFELHGIKDTNEIDEADAFIETWRYDPRVLSEGSVVDPLSLHAQFWNHADERVVEAATQVLETVAW
ncbi:MAG: hypothetical protein GC204_03615 [Chloroflexi bacterium]|nr:hypothetical protein [Chloroflexota bacterium]